MNDPDVELRRHDLSKVVPDIGWYPGQIRDAVARVRVGAELSAIEFRCSGLAGSDASYDAARGALARIIRDCFLDRQLTLLLFRSGASREAPSRVRSHKGALWEIRQHQPLEVTEGERYAGDESVLAALVVVKAENFETLWPLAAAFTRCTFLFRPNSAESVPSSELLELLMDSLEGHDLVMINYPDLVASLHSTPWSVVRFGGDASQTFINVTCFARGATLDALLRTFTPGP